MSHTPGPWTVLEEHGDSTKHPEIIITSWDKDESVDIAYVVNNKEGQANARLVAAAPELLTSLISLANHVDKLEGKRICSGVWMQAKAVIKKATGG